MIYKKEELLLGCRNSSINFSKNYSNKFQIYSFINIILFRTQQVVFISVIQIQLFFSNEDL